MDQFGMACQLLLRVFSIIVWIVCLVFLCKHALTQAIVIEPIMAVLGGIFSYLYAYYQRKRTKTVCSRAQLINQRLSGPADPLLIAVLLLLIKNNLTISLSWGIAIVSVLGFLWIPFGKDKTIIHLLDDPKPTDLSGWLFLTVQVATTLYLLEFGSLLFIWGWIVISTCLFGKIDHHLFLWTCMIELFVTSVLFNGFWLFGIVIGIFIMSIGTLICGLFMNLLWKRKQFFDIQAG
ncbi:hypothetical protein C815_01109 [Firmicutes bacterium M10-2]|nr:hypothetical protein C815_01109 [Firmicutes bacterium M10-2]